MGTGQRLSRLDSPGHFHDMSTYPAASGHAGDSPCRRALQFIAAGFFLQEDAA